MRTKKLTLVFVNHSTTAFTLLHSDRTRSKDADSLSMPLGVHISLWASRRLEKTLRSRHASERTLELHGMGGRPVC